MPWTIGRTSSADRVERMDGTCDHHILINNCFAPVCNLL
jgi:hypothetical protein